MCSNAIWCFGSQWYSLSFFRRSLKTLHWVARLGTNFVRWCTLPRNDFNCLHLFGAFRFWMASVLLMSGFIPFWLISNPSDSISFSAKWHFSKFMLRFSLSSFCNHLKTFPFFGFLFLRRRLWLCHLRKYMYLWGLLVYCLLLFGIVPACLLGRKNL